MKSEQDPETVERWAKALELRRAGKTYREIAKECGYSSVSSCYDAIGVALKAILREPGDDVRTLEVDRLDKLFSVVWPDATKDSPDYKAFDRVLQIMDRRARLLGLDAPSKSVVTANVSNAHQNDAFVASLARIYGAKDSGQSGE